MEPGKRKKKINYTLMVVSDSPDGKIQPFSLEKKLITVLLLVAAAVLLGSVTVALHHYHALKKIQAAEQELRDRAEELTQQNQELVTENAELSDKVAILSNKVTQDEETKKAKEQEEEEKKMPKGFPLAGPAVILQSAETQEDAEPIVVFSASEGIKVIATGSGEVESVETDAVYGYRIKIDHGNGYQSIYRVAEKPLVSGGDRIERGTALYELKTSDERLGYQITKDGNLIDPLDLLEVYG